MTGQLILFFVLAAISIVCAISMILQENPVRSALSLVLVLFSVAMLYFSLHAMFIGVVQIIVYAGAIMVLFIFVIMLLNLGTPERIMDRLRPQRPLSFIAGFATIIILGTIIAAVPKTRLPVPLTTALTGPYEIGMSLFDPAQGWLFPFEVVSILLLVAAVGAVMLAKKRI